ncbi:MAG: hypothetical protein SCM11_20955 [Bacillota bacterium]|nr:hypothetical protein [Bacillota bacterium]
MSLICLYYDKTAAASEVRSVIDFDTFERSNMTFVIASPVSPVAAVLW